MPDWLQLALNLVMVIGLSTVLAWSYKLGRELGSMKTEIKNQEERIKRQEEQTIACNELFRDISTKIGALDAKMEFVIEDIQERKRKARD